MVGTEQELSAHQCGRHGHGQGSVCLPVTILAVSRQRTGTIPHLDVRCLDDRPPFLNISFHERGSFVCNGCGRPGSHSCRPAGPVCRYSCPASLWQQAPTPAHEGRTGLSRQRSGRTAGLPLCAVGAARALEGRLDALCCALSGKRSSDGREMDAIGSCRVTTPEGLAVIYKRPIDRSTKDGMRADVNWWVRRD
jgi:hypothetical protein